MSASPRGRGRWKRITVVALAIVAVLVAFAPSLAGWTLARSIVAGAVADQVNGAVSVAGVQLRWLGPQRVEGLVIDDRAGGNRIDATIEVRRSLLSLLASPLGVSEIVARVDVATTQAPDGTIGLAKLAKAAPSGHAQVPGSPPGAMPAPSPGAAPPASGLPPSLVVSLTLEPSSLSLDRGADGMLKLSNLAGSLRFAAATAALEGELKGAIEGSGASGAVWVKADLRQVLDRRGSFQPAAVIGTARTSISAMALRTAGELSSVRGLLMEVDASSASSPLVTKISLDEALHGGARLREVAAELRLGRDPAAPAGIATTSVEALVHRGEVSITGGGERFTATDLRASVALGAGGGARFDLAAQTAIGPRRGSVSGSGAFEHLFDASFRPTLAGATGSASVKVTQAVIPAGPVQTEIDEFTISVDAREATAPISIRASGTGVARELDGAAERSPAPGERITLVGQLAVARDEQGAYGVSMDPRQISGSIEARSVPSGILRPFIPRMEAVSIDPLRDLGPVLTLALSAPGGAAAPLSLMLQSARLNATASASIDPSTGSVRGGNATIDAILAPELVTTPRLRATNPFPVALRAQGVSLPRTGDRFDFGSASAERLALAVNGTLLVARDDTPLTISGLQASVTSASLAEGVRVDASVTVDGVVASTSADLSGLAALGTDAFDWRSTRARGTLHAGPINWHIRPPVLSGIPAQVVDLGLSSSTITVGFDGGYEQGRAHAKVVDGSQGLSADLDWDRTSLRITGAVASVVVTNQALDALSLAQFRMAQPAPMSITVPTLVLGRAALEAGRPEIPPIQLGVRAGSLPLSAAPGVVEPVTLGSLTSSATLDLANSVALRLSGSTALSDAGGVIAATEFTFNGERLAAPGRTWNAAVDARDIDGARLLRVAGVDPARVPGLAAGDRGTASVRVRSESAGAIAVTFDTAVGAVRGRGAASIAGDGAISVPGADLSVTLDAARSTAFFASERDARGRSLISRAGAVPVAVTVTDLALPVVNGALEPLRASGKARLTSGNLDLEVAGIGAVRLGAVDAELALAGAGRSATLRVNSTIAAAGGGAQPLTVRARLGDFVGADGSLDATRMSLEGEAGIDRLPVALLDVFVDGDGILTDMLGPELMAQLRATSPPGRAGFDLSGTLKSEFVETNLGRVSVADAAVGITRAAPLTMSLIPNATLRQRLLKPINPILEDIRPRRDQPVVFTVNAFSLPTSMDLARFNAEFLLTVGDVEIQRSDSMLNLLRLVRDDADGVLEGNIGPLRGTIDAGRLSYENFIVSFGRVGESWNQQLFFSGDIDLATQPPYARAISVDYPVAGIGRLATGATPFDAFFGRVNTLVDRLPIVDLNALRLRATFHGPIEPDRDLDLAFEPVIVGRDGRPLDLGSLLTELPGRIIESIIGGGGGASKPGAGGTDGGGDGGQSRPQRPRDPVRGILDDLFRRR